MVEAQKDYWWLVALRGIVAIIFGLFALSNPGLSLAFLVLLFGLFTLIGGAVQVVVGLVSIGRDSYWWSVTLGGIVSFVVGLLIFNWTGLSTAGIYFLIAAWAVVTGLIDIFSIFKAGKNDENKMIALLGGLISVILGVLLFAWPNPGIKVVGLIIGIYALVFGVLVLAYGFRLRKS